MTTHQGRRGLWLHGFFLLQREAPGRRWQAFPLQKVQLYHQKHRAERTYLPRYWCWWLRNQTWDKELWLDRGHRQNRHCMKFRALSRERRSHDTPGRPSLWLDGARSPCPPERSWGFQLFSSSSSSPASLAFSRTLSSAVSWWRARSIRSFIISIAWRQKGA